MFSSNLALPGVSFAAALRGSTAKEQQMQTDTSAGVKLSNQASGNQQNTGQSVRAPTVSSQTLDNMLSVVTALEQIMTEFNGSVSEDKIVAITKIVLNLMKQDGH
jgi:uncharacterized membrane protein YcgQ (UPF0703/DUF1980 family)